MIPKAQAETAELGRRRPGLAIKTLMRAEPYQDEADAQRLIDGLRQAGMPEREPARLAASDPH